MLSLHPTADRMPESSLGQMISWMIEEFGAGDALCVADRKGVEIAPALEFLRSAQRRGQPVCVMATTAAFGALFDELRAQRLRLSLAPGSRLMDTGGAKGQTVPLRPGQVVEHAQALLGLDPAMVINEYGMTEMCSQLYDATSFNSRNSRNSHLAEALPEERPESAASWGRPGSALRRSTLRASNASRMAIPGLLRFFDLANVGSVSAILTGDLGDRTGRGRQGARPCGGRRGARLRTRNRAVCRETRADRSGGSTDQAHMNRATTAGTAVAGLPASRAARRRFGGVGFRRPPR